MATVNIKKTDGSYERVADTLGAINSPVEYLQGRLTGTSVTIDANFKAFSADPSTLSGTLQYQIENGYCRFIANVDGIYSLNWGRGYASASIAGARLVTSVYDKYGTKISEVIGLGWVDSRYVENAMSTFTGYLTKDQYILLGVYDRSVTLDDSLPVFNQFTFVRHEISMPYVVANKGALVSGGAFQFDDAGHGYTDNYSTEETRCGVWTDNTPIYRKTFTLTDFSIPMNTGTGLGVYIPGIKMILKSEVIDISGATYQGSIPCAVFLDVSTRQLCVIGTPLAQNLPEDYTITVYYTKNEE